MKKEMNFQKIYEFIKFAIVGGLMTILNFVLLYIMIEFLDMNYIVANVLSYSVAVVISYFLNAVFTFESQSYTKENKKLIKYFLMRLTLLIIDSFCLYILVNFLSMNVYISKILLTIFFFMVSFGISKRIITNK